jgi:hypothetical protein
MNQHSKPWYLSKGFVGPLVTAILFSLRSLGIADFDSDTVLGILYQSAEFAGIIAGMIGRAIAQKKLTLGPTPSIGPAGQPTSGSKTPLSRRLGKMGRPASDPQCTPGEE